MRFMQSKVFHAKASRAAAIATWIGICGAMPLTAAQAAENFPTRPVRIIAASAPGSGPDVISRLLSDPLARNLGQQIIVENRPGAGGNIGAEVAARADPDGYTMLLATANHAIGANLYTHLKYDLLKDFTTVSEVASVPYLLVVHPSLPVKSVKELIALAKKRPGEINYGSGGSGSPPHLAAEIFASMTGIDIVHIPYKGVTPALNDLVAGRVQLVFSAVTAALPFVKSGRLRPLGISGPEPSNLVPDVPVIGATVPGYEVLGWYGLLVPAGTPKHIIARLNQAVVQAVHAPAVSKRLAASGAKPLGTSPAEFAKMLRAEVEKWGEAVRKSGARVE